ncbi:MAG: S66 family peptidase [Pseudonocardiaceae bacterium]
MVATSMAGPYLISERFRRGVSSLEALGYEVIVMPHAVGCGDGVRTWVSGSREERLQDLHDAFNDPSVDAIFSAIGGAHSAHLLEDLDVNLIAANPKIFCGYSDATVLLHAIFARTGLVTFYGPAIIPEFGEYGGPDAEVLDQLIRVATKRDAPWVFPCVDWQAVESREQSDAELRARRRQVGECRVCLRSGTATGPLFAGCLPSLRELVGTPWQPDYDGSLLLLDLPGEPYDVSTADADVNFLRNAGIFDGIKALLIGRSSGWTSDELAQLHFCVRDATRGYEFPVLAGLECSHAAPLLAIPIGTVCTISDRELIILEPAVL